MEDEILRPIILKRSKSIEKTNKNIMNYMMQMTEGEINHTLDPDTVQENLLQVFFKSVFRDFESYLRTRRVSSDIFELILKVYFFCSLILNNHQEFMKS